jgi:WXXGXW repeat (2 copies)
MRKLLQTLTLSTLILASASSAQAQISFGIHIGEPPAARSYRVPRQPGADYVWVEGYWYPQDSRYVWHNGYWTRPPYPGAYWVGPYYDAGQYFSGQWEGGRGNMAHNHRWDQGAQRDERRLPPPPPPPVHRPDEHDRR